MLMPYPTRPWIVAGLIAITGMAQAGDTTPAGQLARWSQEAGRPGQVQSGEVFFKSKHGGEWSCSSCHGAPPTRTGQHANTGKAIPPLAPSFNVESLTNGAKTDKWFRRNCKDVLARECTAAEKADVLAYLLSLKP